ncbi:hypothetical protein [Methylocystis rosea]|uniref:Uncharacterized protein n=1 Tax=Methylocystis rosea TaxID=173366 RepID=A0A3G8M2U1_9HYPH|nr:hypothetical protein [Methylocystis rosea]AZG76283.1 hypothetical protein EHO51_05825 [Methylocystis rosea]
MSQVAAGNADHRQDDASREPETPGPLPRGDRSRLLPERSRCKYFAIKTQCAEANAIARDLAARANDLREKIQSKTALRNNFLNGAHDGLSHSEREPYAVELEAEIRELVEARNRLEERTVAHAERRNVLAALDRRLTEFLASLSAAPAAAAPLDLKLSADKFDTELAKTRAQIRDLLERIAQVERAPHPSGVVKARARAKIEALAAHPNVRVAVEHGEDFRFPTIVEKTGAAIDVGGLLCWLLKDRLIAAVEREIDEVADDSRALDATTRKRMRTDLAAELFAAESREEAIISAAEAVGRTFDRRADGDVRAVLGLAAARP